MTTFDEAVETIAVRRVRMLLEGDVQYEGFMDAAEVNGLAEVYDTTYTEAWDAVRVAFRRQLQLLA